jgi:hypothetical protein
MGAVTAKEKTLLSYAGRFLLLLILPFVLGAWVFPHTQSMDGQMLRSPHESVSGVEVSYSFTHSGMDITVPQRVNAIFPLADYLSFPPLVMHSQPMLCFQDNDSYLIFQDGGKLDPDFIWLVDFNNKTQLVVPPYGTNCTPADTGGQNAYKWYAKIVIPTNDPRFKGNVTFVPQTLTYPRIIMDFGLLQGLIMIPVCYLFIWYPAAGIWKKLHKGFLEQ